MKQAFLFQIVQILFHDSVVKILNLSLHPLHPSTTINATRQTVAEPY